MPYVIHLRQLVLILTLTVKVPQLLIRSLNLLGAKFKYLRDKVHIINSLKLLQEIENKLFIFKKTIVAIGIIREMKTHSTTPGS